MKTNLKNFSILSAAWLFFALGCGGDGGSSSSGAQEANGPSVERGRLKFAKSGTALNLGREPIYRSVSQSFYVNGKQWTPVNDKDLAGRINWCDVSPNPQVEILRCPGDATESYKTTYILRMKDDKPEVQKIDEGLPSSWIDADGRWLLFSKLLLNVETGEKINFNTTSPSDPQESSVLPLYLLGVSPDLKTIAQLPDKSTQKEGAEEFLIVWIIETDTGKTEKRKVSFTKYPWLKDYKQPEGNMQFPPVQANKLVWEKRADGRYKLLVPAL